jgi:glycosyltransferase involved in cell wall biosynthesis
MNPLINILIRHKEGRENDLQRCLKSIWEQSYSNYRIVLSIQWEHNYKEFEGFDIIKVPSQHYNLHCNDLKKQVTDGWFFFMDDDDYLASPTVLEELSKDLLEGALIVQFLRKNNKNIKGHDVVKPTDHMIEKGIIKKGMIGGGCLVLHHSFKDVADWKGYAGADYDWIAELRDKGIPFRFVKLILQISEKANLGK